MQQAAAAERRALHLTKQSIANEEKPNYKGLSMPNEIKLGFDDDLTNTVQSLYFDIDLNKIVETTLSIMTQNYIMGSILFIFLMPYRFGICPNLSAFMWLTMPKAVL